MFPSEETRKMVVAANVAAALASGGLAMAAVINPGLLLPERDEVTPAVKFYAKYFAARSLPLSMMVVVLVLLGSNNWLGAFLILSGLVQAADALILASYRNQAQSLAPAAAATVHLVSAWWLLHGRSRPWRD